MKLKRFSKSVAALMTAMMLVTVVPTTSFTALAADGEDVEVTVEEASEEAVESVEAETAEELTEEVITEEAEGEDIAEATEEIADEDLAELVEDVEDEFDEDCDENNIEENGGLLDSTMYYLLYSGMTDDNHPLTPGLPYDYNGLGYFLKNKYNVKPMVVNKAGNMALGGIEAEIYTKDKHHFLHIKGYYEIYVDVWKYCTGANWWDNASAHGNPYTYVQGAPTKEAGFGGPITAGTSDDKQPREAHGGIQYFGPDGKIPVRWSVNDKYTIDDRLGYVCTSHKSEATGKTSPYTHIKYANGLACDNDGHYYIHDELSVKVPSTIKANPESYYGQFDYTYEIGQTESKVGYSQYYEKVNKVVIREILGVPVHMEVYQNAFYPEIIDNVGIIDKVDDGTNTTYTIQFDTNTGRGGDYDITITNGVGSQTERLSLVVGKHSQTLTVKLPTSPYGLNISSIITPGYTTVGESENGVKFEHMKSIPDWSFSIDIGDVTSKLGADILNLKTTAGYNVSVGGKYEFLYTYIVDGQKKYYSDTIEFKSPINDLLEERLFPFIQNDQGPVTFLNADYYVARATSGKQDISVSFPANASEVRLSNVTSPDGNKKYINKILYQNKALLPKIPSEFEASVKLIGVNSYSYGAGVYKGMKEFSMLVEYAAPSKATRYLNIEYKDGDEVKTARYTIPSIETGYDTYAFVNSNKYPEYVKVGSNGNPKNQNPVQINYKDLKYVKVVSLEDENGKVTGCEQYLYCNHPYKNACQAECPECHTIREISHDYKKNCTICSVCGHVRLYPHSYQTTCQEKCDNCEYTGREYLVHEAKSFYNARCKYCDEVLNTGWAQIDDSNNWYFFHTDGKMARGEWQLDGKQYYYLGKNGAMVKNGWVQDGSKRYYCGANGKYLKSQWKNIDGKDYYFGADGAMYVNKWKDYKGAWYYLGENGAMHVNAWILYKNDYYHVGKTGAMDTNKWIASGGKYYYVDDDGIMVKRAWVQYKDKWYYCDGTGAMVTGTQTIGGKKYTFGSDGAWIK